MVFKRSSKNKRSSEEKRIETASTEVETEDRVIRDLQWRKKKHATRPKRFSLLRGFTIADFITLANAVCGTCVIFLCLNYLENDKKLNYIVGAFSLFPLGLLFDIVDGSVARYRIAQGKEGSPYGLDLDSLADVITFGVAPAVLGFTLGFRGFWDSVFLAFSVCCGVGRLARFNVTADFLATSSGKVKFFEGLPIPGNLLNVLLLLFLWCNDLVLENLPFGKWEVFPGHFHPLSLSYFLSGCLMISTLKIPKW